MRLVQARDGQAEPLARGIARELGLEGLRTQAQQFGQAALAGTERALDGRLRLARHASPLGLRIEGGALRVVRDAGPLDFRGHLALAAIELDFGFRQLRARRGQAWGIARLGVQRDRDTHAQGVAVTGAVGVTVETAVTLGLSRRVARA